MKLEQIVINDKKEANLVLAFGERFFLEKVLPYKKINTYW